MNTRIRYKSVEGTTVFESTRDFLTRDGMLLKASYDCSSLTVSLKTSEGEVVYTDSYKHLHTAKSKLKNKLKELGVAFTDELRRKKETV